MKRRRYSRLVACVVVATSTFGLVTLAGTAHAASTTNPGVVPPNAMVGGQSYGQWSTRWWNWAASVTADKNPLGDDGGKYCAVNQSGRVWFLAGSAPGSPPADRSCTIPLGTRILFPVINFVAAFPVEGTDDAGIKAAANSAMDKVTSTEATVDGRTLSNIKASYRFESPFFNLVVADGNQQVLGYDKGPHRAISDGYWVMLEPLSKGQHNIHFRAVSPGYNPEATYHLTVR